MDWRLLDRVEEAIEMALEVRRDAAGDGGAGRFECKEDRERCLLAIVIESRGLGKGVGIMDVDVVGTLGVDAALMEAVKAVRSTDRVRALSKPEPDDDEATGKNEGPPVDALLSGKLVEVVVGVVEVGSFDFRGSFEMGGRANS